MNAEQLLKSISELIKKNKSFLSDNPEIFHLVEDRLFKAIDDNYNPDDEMDDEDFYDQSHDESGISTMFDDIPEDDIDENMDGELDEDEADQWLQENEAEISQGSDIDSDGDIDLPEEARQQIKDNDANTDKKKVSSSGYRDWSPKDKYEDEHQASIDDHMNNGWSHREAERMAGAHDTPTDFNSALKSKIKPTQPSDKMLEQMKGLSGDWLRNAERKIGESADARKNPIKHAAAKTLSAHEDAHGDFKTAFDKFLASDEVNGLKHRERYKAIKAFKEKYNEDNPSHREGVIAAADSGKAFKDADEARAAHLLEGHQSVQDAGKSGGELTTASEFSTAAAGGTENLTAQGAAQMAGGTQDEGGYTTGTIKDPNMVFSEKNQPYIDSEARKKSIDRLKTRLNPEQAQRFSALQGVSKKGNE
ncbi:hypothetical protein GOV06_00650 [Candidatus Woesearchaeota archaeon]|nr:hypothetical protein [Candidatus Woesearchaeota archaeon]